MSLLSPRAVRRLIGSGPLEVPTKPICGANGKWIPVMGSITLPLEIQSIVLPEVSFLVVPGLQFDVLLGIDVLRNLPFRLDFLSGTLDIPTAVEPNEIEQGSHPCGEEVRDDSMYQTPHQRAELCKKTKRQRTNKRRLHAVKLLNAESKPPELMEEEEYDINSNLTAQQHRELCKIMRKYRDSTQNKETKANRIQHNIRLMKETSVYQHPYRTSFEKQTFIQNEVKKLLAEGKIRHSSSPYGSPVVLPVKKNGSYRFAIDYRRLNAITQRDGFPLPRIDDLLDRISGAKYFAIMDAKSGYHQVPMAQADVPKTAFVTSDGQYEWLVMPFGLCNAPATFQRMMTQILLGLAPKRCVFYIDDILVFGATWENFIENLDKVLNALTGAGIELNWTKCHFGYTEIEFLGHVVSQDGIRPSKTKSQDLQQYPTPEDKKSLQSFLGLAGYFSKFVPNYSSKVFCLRQLLRQKANWKWTQIHQHAFDTIKADLFHAPTLVHYKQECDHLLFTDASGVGLGAVLVQVENGIQSPIAYASRALSDAEKRYNTTEKEALAVVWAITEKFFVYLQGRRFTVKTDHANLCGELKLNKPSTARLSRMILRLQEYDFRLEYTKGNANIADGLSRIPEPVVAMVKPTQGNSDCYTGVEHQNLPKFRLEQEKDQNLRHLIQILEKHPNERDFHERKRVKSYHLLSEILCHNSRKVLPIHLRPDEMARVHRISHPGVTRMIATLRTEFWWPTMNQDVRGFCRKCLQCQKQAQIPRKGITQAINTTTVFELCGVDIIGPISKSSLDDHKYIVTAIDLHSRFAFAEAVSSQTISQVICFLKRIFCLFGSPKAILTDNARIFRSTEFKHFCQYHCIEHRFTPVGHPQTNGANERFNKTLLSQLRKMASHDMQRWDLCLPDIIFGYNNTVNLAHGLTPFLAMFGRSANREEYNEWQIQPSAWQGTFDSRMELIKETSRRRKQRWCFRPDHRKFEIGDKVLVRNLNRRRRKLDPLWEGPEKVEAVEGSCVRLEGRNGQWSKRDLKKMIEV